MKILRRQKKAAVKPAGERRPASADARITLSTFGGSLLALESRIMFDGAAVATASTVTTEQVAHSQAEASVSAEKAVTADTAVHAPTGEAPTGFAAPPTGDQALVHALATYDSAAEHHEILFISASVLDYQQLLDGISPNVEVHVLDPARDGVAQMVQILAGRTGIDAIHLIGDGSEAEMHLGASFLTQDSISTTYAAQFQQIGRSLSASADILIYGCDFGRGADGLLAMNTLATLTGAAVAASTDPTGNVALGANWVLEASTGSIDTSVVIGASTQAAWDHSLLTYTVTNTNDSGAGSLRQAILNSNANAGFDTINFTIPGGGVHTINLASALPTITGSVLIDGYSEAGSSVNTLSVGDNAVLKIVLNGSGAGAASTGLVLGAGSDGSTIRGLVIDNFKADGIDVNSTTNHIIGNWVGINSTGTVNAGNAVDGIAINGNNNTIGSATLADRNVLSGNHDEGVDSKAGVTGTVIQGNYIGTNALGTAAIPNGILTDPTSCGVDLTGGVLLGGSLAGQGNLISGNINANIIIEGNGNQIYGNLIGTTAAGAAGIVNGGPGIWFASGSNNSIGGTTAGQGNTIAYNTGVGVDIAAATSVGNTILGNSIFSNTGLGIDLGNDGVTLNDLGDPDSGANDLKNFPVLTSAVVNSTSTVIISGTYNSVPGVRTYRIEFFASAIGDPSGYGEGQRYLGFTNVTTDVTGNVSYSVTLSATVAAGEVVSATTTDITLNETSEFCKDIVASNTAPVLNGAISPTLTTETEDASAPSGSVGTLVSALVSFASNVTDPDPSALLGIAITAANTINGTWFYSINNGTSWNALGAVANNNALLLAADANTRLYFQPNADWNGTMASAITIRAWDQTSGSNGTKVSTTTNGGNTAFSTATESVSLTTTAVNDAPIATGAATLGAIVEDTAAPVGATVTALFSGNFSDAADAVAGGSSANTFAGIAISNYTANATQGAWQYSTNGGTTWVALANAGPATAVTLKTTDMLRFVPVADFNGAATALSANLIESGLAITSGATVNLTLPGATGDPSHISAATVALGETVTAVNDAPIATGAATLGAIVEDTAAPVGATVTALFSGNFSDAADAVAGGSSANTFAGIAISNYTANATQGAWQYSTNGGTTWVALANAGPATAVTLKTTDMLRFVPVADFNGAATALSANLIESGLAITSGATVNLTLPGATGDPSHISAATVALGETVTAVNDAPIATGAATLGAIVEDTAAPVGATVTALFSGNFSDAADAVAGGSSANTFAGIAISNYTANATQGAWQYSTNGGTTWVALANAGPATAVTLKTTDMLRFVPVADFNGAATALSANLIESGLAITSGATVDLTLPGATGDPSHISAATVALGETVTAVNDAPIATGAATLGAIVEDTAAPVGATVTALFSGNFSDAADAVAGGSSANTFAGIAISNYTANATQGAWQYSTNGGTTWVALANAGPATAVTLKTTDMLRFVPVADFNGAATALSANLIESGLAITSGATVNLTLPGATGDPSHISAATVALGETVTAVNDAPIATGAATLGAIVEDTAAPVGATVTALFSGNFSDAADAVAGGSSANTFAGIAISNYTANATQGAWQYSTDGGTTWVALANAGPATAVTLKTTDMLRFVPVADFNGAATALSANLIESGLAITSGATVNLTLPGATGDPSHISAATVALGETVTAVNDAPIATGAATLGAIVEDTAAPVGATVTALFSGNFSDAADAVAGGSSANTFAGIAISNYTANATQGAWQYSTNGGTTWVALANAGPATAVTLKTTDMLRFVPVADFNGAATALSANLIESGLAITSGATVDLTLPGATGDPSHISAATVALGETVTAVNDAPIATGAATLGAIVEDTAAPVGATVTALFSGNFSDAADAVAGGSSANTFAGIAISNYTANATQGAWQYSTNGGTTWVALANAGPATAVTLKTTDMLRFVPVADFNGAATALSANLIESGLAITSGATVDLTLPGATGDPSHISAATVALGETVTAVNDAPIATGAATLGAIVEDTAAPVGATVTALFSGNFSDAADAVAGGSSANTFAGIAISNYTANATQGAWQYSTDGGTTWVALANAGPATAVTLKTTDMLRFVPVADFNGAATALSANLIESGLAITSGATVDLTLPGATGDPSHISAATVALGETVTAVNDAPIATGAATLGAIVEDTAAPVGATVTALFSGNFSDAADAVAGGSSANTFAGIAISNYTANATQGAWQYSTNGGTTWVALANAGPATAVTLKTTDMLRFVPVADFNGAATALSANLIESGLAITSGATVNLTLPGATGDPSHISAATVALGETVTAVNDAPIATGAATLGAIVEDTAAPVGATVTALFSGNFSDAADAVAGGSSANTFAGIAISNYTANATQGAWQYSTDGGTTWVALANAGPATAVTLKTTDMLRFVPVADFNGAATALSANLIESGLAITSGATVDLTLPGATGDPSHISAATVALGETVTAVNDAPIATGAATLGAIVEDTAAPVGATVTALFSGNFSDAADAVAGGSSANTFAGIAISNYTANATQGAWQYSTNGGTTWVALANAGPATAVTLKTTDMLRFVPVADFNGAATALSANLIESGLAITSGATVNLTLPGATGDPSHISAATVALGETVTAVNDAPIATGAATLGAIVEDTAAPVGATVTALFSGNFSDAADAVAGGSSANTFAGIAISNYTANATQGAWQYSTDGGTTWVALANAGPATAVTLKTTDMLRFVPVADFNGAATALSANLIESGLAITSGATVNLTLPGATGDPSHISAATVALGETVTAVNDAPIATGAATLGAIVEDTAAPVGATVTALFSGNFSDAADAVAGGSSANTFAGIAISNYTANATQGAWQYSTDGGTTWVALANAGPATAVTLKTTDMLRFVPVADFNGAATALSANLIESGLAITSGATVDLTLPGATGDPSHISAATVALGETVTAVNDAPIATGAATLGAIVEDTAAPVGATVTALFSGNFSDAADAVAGGSSANTFAGIAISNYTANATQGAWQYSTDGGTTWVALANAGPATAVTLNATDMLRFVPVADFNGAATALSANLIESGLAITSGATVDLTLPGATGDPSHISAATVALGETVTAVNDAPIATGAATLGAIVEDTAAPVGATVTALFSGNFSDAADAVAGGSSANTFAGIAISNYTANATQGAWQYSTDGGTTWVALANAGPATAVTLNATDMLRFVPVADFNGAATALSANLIESGLAITSGATVDLTLPGATGDPSHISAATVALGETVTAVNDAPIATGAATLGAIVEDTAAPVGATVTALFSGNFSDAADAVAGGSSANTFAGIAISNYTANATQGAWQYSTDGGTTWVALANAGPATAVTLNATDMLRFVPVADFNGAATALSANLIESGLAITSGATVDLTLPGATGDPSHISAATVALGETVTAVNDAPIATGAATLGAIVEDTAAPVGATVTALFSGNFSDAADAVAGGSSANTFAGIAISNYTANATQGAWQYSTDGGTTWVALANAGPATAVTLNATDMLRFVPVADFNGAATALSANLIESGLAITSGATVDLTLPGATGDPSHISAATVALGETVTAVNDAPIATGAATLGAIVEDTAAPVGATVTALFSGNFSDAADAVAGGSSANTFAGIAISNYTANATQGAWQYSTDGGTTWVALANAGPATAVTLNATDMLRFVPVADFNGAATALSANLIESGLAITSGATVDLTLPGATGDPSHISAATVALGETVTAVNDAPIATGAATLGAIVEDTAAPVGATVTALFSGNFSDAADAVAGGSSANTFAGIAISNYTANATQGAWQYSTDGGTTWVALANAGPATAVTLNATDMLRFVPVADFNGAATALSANLIESGLAITSGATVDLTLPGATGDPSHISAATVALGETVTAVNDAPIATGAATLGAIVEDTAAPVGATVTALFSGNFSDAADAVAGGSSANTFAGIAISNYTANATQGAWQYSTDGGTTWVALANAGPATAVTLKTTDMLRFVPVADFNGAATALSANLIESGLAITSGATVDLTLPGATGDPSHISAATVALGETVTAVNDAPIATGAATLGAIVEDTAAPVGATVTALFSGNFSDAADAVAGGSSANTFAGIAISNYTANATQGAWQYSTDGGTTWVALANAGPATAVTLNATDMLRFVPVADFNGAATALSANLIESGLAITSGATVDLTLPGATGDPSHISAATVALGETVTAVNDAPIATGAATLGAIVEDTAAPVGATVTALFSGNFSDAADAVAGGSSANTFAGIAISNYTANATQGAWQYSTDGGTTWVALANAGPATAVTLNATDMLRFVPVADFNGAATALSANLIESGLAITSGATVDLTLPGATGDPSHISAATVALGETVTAVNDAPIATGAATLGAIVEDTAAPVGATVTALFSGNFSDAADAVAGGSSANTFAGIAISNYTANATQGAWQYSTDGGTTWVALANAGPATAVTLNATDMLRFVPVADFNGAATALSANLIESGLAITSGATVDLTLPGATGDPSHISAATVALGETVTAVNDAPIATGAATLGAIVEDTAAPVGATVTALFSGNFSDAADAVAGGSSANTFAGIAISNYTANATQGAWQYSTDGGTTWVALANAGPATAVTLNATDMLRFVPVADFNGAATALSANLIESGLAITSGATVDLTLPGATGDPSHISAATVALGETVTAVNDAPIATGAATLGAIVEDTAAPVGATVTALFSGNFSDAADAVAGGSSANTFAGIAISNYTANATQGAWQYSTDGGTTWVALANAGPATAVTLNATDMLRFVPVADFNGAATALSANLIESGLAITSGATVDLTLPGATGDPSHISAATVALGETVTAVNDAPIATGAATLGAIVEDTAAPVGATVTALFSGNFSDAADAVAGGSSANTFAGIAISNYTANATQGAWQYSTDGGTTWVALANAGPATAVTLNATDMLRFVPVADFNGAATALSANLIESGLAITSGATVDLTLPGATGDPSHISAATVALGETVTAVNDAPIATGAATLGAIVEDTAAPVGATVTALFSGNFSDAADAVAGGSSANTFAGIAISNYTANATQGAWQYSTNGGTTWVALANAGPATAVTLNATDMLRFVPVADFNGAATALSANLIESGLAITSGATVDLTLPGATGDPSHISAATVALGETVTAVPVPVTVPLFFPPPVPVPVPVPAPVPVLGPSVSPVSPPLSSSVGTPVLPTPVLALVQSGGNSVDLGVGADDPVKRAALPSRTFARVEQPNVVLDEPSVLSLEPLSIPVKTMLAVGHKFAERLAQLGDDLERAVQEREHRAHLMGQAASFSMIALTAGFVAWLLHGGSLLASFLVTLPAWRRFDPLPVLGTSGQDRRKRNRKKREDAERENEQFRGLGRVLDKSAKPAKQHETGRVRRPKS